MAYNTFRSSAPDNSLQLADGYKLTSSSGLTYDVNGFAGVLTLSESGSGLPVGINLFDSTGNLSLFMNSLGTGSFSIGALINLGDFVPTLEETPTTTFEVGISNNGVAEQATRMKFTITSGGTVVDNGNGGHLFYSTVDPTFDGYDGSTSDRKFNKINNVTAATMLRSHSQDGFTPFNIALTGSTNYNSAYVIRANYTSGGTAHYGSFMNPSGSTDGYSSYILIDESITGGTFHSLVNFHAYTPAAEGPAAKLFQTLPMYQGFIAPTGSPNTNGQLYYSPGSGITFIDVYGFKVDDLKNSPNNTVTNAYAFYSEGANDLSYFAGKVGVGKVPTKTLDISGNTSIYGGYYGKCTTISTSGTTAVDGSTQVYWCDTSPGNITLTLDPAALGNLFFEVKKLGTDSNSITISMTTGSIYGTAGAASSFSFNSAGGSASVRSNGTDAIVV